MKHSQSGLLQQGQQQEGLLRDREPLTLPLSQQSNSNSSSSAQKHQQSPLLLHHQLPILDYEVTNWSSYSAQYHPKHIRENKPTDQGSRWSSGSNNQNQYILLELSKPAIVHTITFGKYHKVHVCNLKEFKVYGGMNKSKLTELLHSGLRNDNEMETFPLKFQTSQGITFPCKYIKIVPLMAWGANFNFSIWFVELRGLNAQETISHAVSQYTNWAERESLRLCLKHLRQRNLMIPFEMIQKETGIKLEDDMLTDLHRKLVQDGDFAGVEAILRKACESGMFAEYIRESPYKPQWTRIFAKDDNGDSPTMRGGHQMTIDLENRLIYLIGGWDGTKDLSDFWVFDCANEKWHCLSQDTSKDGGPGPRSCHKICFDQTSRRIYLLGKYIDLQSRANVAADSDFYSYNCITNKWSKLSDNTFLEGGPELIYDHQMCIDAARRMMYVFGGKIIPNPAVGTNVVQGNSPETSYSGLYSYDLTTGLWKLLRNDQTSPSSPNGTQSGGVQLKSRIGHSMLFHPISRLMYIFAGQRLKDYLSDYYVYDVDREVVIEMNRDSSKNGGPDAGFTQRATIDPEANEFYVFSGLMREKGSSTETVKNSFWVYSITKDKWTKIYQNDNTGHDYWKSMEKLEPCPRFAHQLIYDEKTKTQYLFGGNPGEASNTGARLDDFWKLKLNRDAESDILRKCLFLVRRERFREMCSIMKGDDPSMSGTSNSDSLAALKYLQVDISGVVNHHNEEESKEFRAITGFLFEKKEYEDVFTKRTEVYEKLLEFFPESMKQPKNNLIDLIQ